MKDKEKDVISQMVEGIIGSEPDKNATPEEIEKYKQAKANLSGRALEYYMFMDDDEGISTSADEPKASNIIIFPDFQKLKDNVERMRTELSMLLLERDELQFVICKNIETAYYLKLGALEHKAYEAQCAALRLKRKIELIQARINRQEKVIISQIESILDNEFEEYQAKLNEQIDKMNEALKRSTAECLTEQENAELKKLYRNVVKKLHPDVNPNVSDAEIRLLDNAVNAYKNGDLAALRIIEEMVSDHTLPEHTQDAMSMLTEENERLEKMLSSIRESIDEIKSRYPYSVKDIVEEPEKEAERKAELESILAQYKEMIEIYKSRLAEMLR